MNLNFDLNHEKGFPFLLPDYQRSLAGIKTAQSVLLEILGKNQASEPVIVDGLRIVDLSGGIFNVSSGHVFYQGSIIPVQNSASFAAAGPGDIYFNINKINIENRTWGDGQVREAFSQYEITYTTGAGEYKIVDRSRINGSDFLTLSSGWTQPSGGLSDFPTLNKTGNRLRLSGRAQYSGASQGSGIIMCAALPFFPTNPGYLCITPISLLRGSAHHQANARITTAGEIHIHPLSGATIESGDIVNLECVEWLRG